MPAAFKPVLAILIVLLLGCATGDPAHDHPDADPEPARAPALEPPPAARRRLSPEDVLAIGGVSIAGDRLDGAMMSAEIAEHFGA